MTTSREAIERETLRLAAECVRANNTNGIRLAADALLDRLAEDPDARAAMFSVARVAIDEMEKLA